jgi:hypothetical protein
MYCATANLLNFYGITQESADARKTGVIFDKPAVKETANGYAPNDIHVAEKDVQGYFDRLNNISEASIYDNSFVKLREIALSYPVWDKKSLNVSLNIFARNILLWSDIKGLDTEISQGNNNMSGAFERFSLPGTSSYGLGINVKF